MRPGPARDALRVAARSTGVSRRHVLQAAGLAAATTVLPVQAARAVPSTEAARRGPKVVIIGAGMAGLGAALRLRDAYGIDADIYEYADRSGGRIRTLRGHFAQRQLVEEHAEFINPEHTATRGLAKRFGLSLDNTDHYPEPRQDQLTLRFHGKPWSQQQLNHDWHRFGWKLFHDAAVRQAPWPTTYTHSTAAGRRFDAMSAAEWVETYVPGGVASDFGQLCISAVLDEYGGQADEQSALNLVYLLGGDASRRSGDQPKSGPALEGADEKWHISGGNDQLITGILKRLKPGAVHHGRRLVSVRARGHGRYAVDFERGHTVHADHVVLALPFTTLRDVDLDHAGIAKLHRRAIREQPMGSNAKLFLQFSHRIWDEAKRTGNVYCRGVVQGAWDATNYQAGRAGILAALPGGAVGADWGSRYHLRTYRGDAPEVMVRDYLPAYDALFPGARKAFNGRSFYVWSSGDPHIRGAYSYLRVGQYTGFNGIQGRREGNLHFAGEHTSINYQGYIEGALRSGRRCADEIAGKS